MIPEIHAELLIVGGRGDPDRRADPQSTGADDRGPYESSYLSGGLKI